jgi:hypothetical protein
MIIRSCTEREQEGTCNKGKWFARTEFCATENNRSSYKDRSSFARSVMMKTCPNEIGGGGFSYNRQQTTVGRHSAGVSSRDQYMNFSILGHPPQLSTTIIFPFTKVQRSMCILNLIVRPLRSLPRSEPVSNG